MALIDKTDPLWPRVSAAFNAITGPAPKDMATDDFAQNRIMEFIKSVVRNYESNFALQPAKATVEAAVTKVEADFDSQIAKVAPVAVPDGK